jgi:asparagine synthase (glutamine-hydrolysing)
MCGFQGAWCELGFSREFRDKWHNSRHILGHRGPDATREFSTESVLLLFHRLSILDLSDKAEQPMRSRDGRLVLAWNGELYNYLELRRDFLDDSYRTAGDTEVALGMLSRFGLTALSMFRGMFAFALWDVQGQVLTLCRDRFGIKPLYWSRARNTLVFASEIKGLLALGVPVSPNLEVIGKYLRSNRTEDGSDTFFEGVSRVEPGCYLQFRGEHMKPVCTRWYELPLEMRPFSGTRQEAASELVKVLAESCEIHSRSDVGVAVNVSGGVDSSLLVALAESFVSSGMVLFSVDYPGTEYSERKYVESLLVDGLGRTVFYTDFNEHEMVEGLDEAVWSQDEPFGGIPTLAWYPHFENVRMQGFKVVLDGSGLDDLLGGYLKHVIAAYATGAVNLESESFSEIADAWGLSDASVGDMYRKFREAGRAIDGTSGVMPELCRIAAVADGEHPELYSFYEHLKQSFGSSKLYGALRFKDRASMWRGTEVRVPFVDHKVAEFCLSLPAEYLVSHGRGKALLREGIGKLISDRIAQSPKRSVQSPQREILTKGPFADALRECLEKPSELLSEVIDTSQALRYVETLRFMPPANSNAMWQWLNLDRWAKRFL